MIAPNVILNIITGILFIFLIVGIENVHAQEKDKAATKLTELTLVGTELPDYTFPRVKNYRSEFGADKVPLSDLQGKWLVLYFWTRNCTPCVNTFPTLREIALEYKEEVQIMLVGINDMYNRNTEAFYDGVRAVQKFSLPIAYDTVLVKKLQIIYSGTIVFVNPEGIIEKVSHGTDFSSKDMKAIIRRRPKSKTKEGA